MNGTLVLHLCHIFRNCYVISPEYRKDEFLNSGLAVLQMVIGWNLLEQPYCQSIIKDISRKISNLARKGQEYFLQNLLFGISILRELLATSALKNNSSKDTGKTQNHSTKQSSTNEQAVENYKKTCKDFESEKDEMEDALEDLREDQWNPTGTHLWVYAVPRYPDNYNPLLPLSLQQRLDEMSPRDFLSYILEDLTVEERESLLVDEKQRRKTFLVNWSHSNNLSGIKMAQAGFYCLNDYDRVQCVFCRGSLHQWEVDDDPMTGHARSFNFCRFVKRLECGNREYESNSFSKEELRNVTKLRVIAEKNDGMIDGESLGISTNRAAMIHYAPDSTRIKSFSRWPPSSLISGQRMCDAGFYYTGFDDQVCCFYCYGGIREWSANDDPWEEHARWFPDCDFLVQQKGQHYVELVHARTPQHQKCVRKTKFQQKAKVKEVEVRSEQEDMSLCCRELGHSAEAINNVIARNGAPFDDIKVMIDALYALEENDNSADVVADLCERWNYTGTSTEHQLPLDQNLISSELDRQRYLNQDIPATIHGTFHGSERKEKCKVGCINCDIRTDRLVLATHVGLPCGHLIYCDSCNEEEKRKTSNVDYSPKCPFHGCCKTLAGSIKILLA